LKTYHDSGTVAICQSTNRPGDSPGFVGSADSPDEVPEPLQACHGADKPPLTNRGALITIPLVNQFLFDWAAFTFKLNDPQEVISILGLKSSLFTELERGTRPSW
jgi:hypothetical protein